MIAGRRFGFEEAAFDGEGSHTRQEIPAVLAVGHEGFVHADLQEQVVDVGIAIRRG